MTELLNMLSQLPYPILLIALVAEFALIILLIQIFIEDKPSKIKAGLKGGVVTQIAAEEYKAVFKVIEKRLNEVSARLDMCEKKILELESRGLSGAASPSPAGLENKVNELQKIVFSIVEKIKEFQ